MPHFKNKKEMAGLYVGKGLAMQDFGISTSLRRSSQIQKA
jgi:hypothetical protein